GGGRFLLRAGRHAATAAEAFDRPFEGGVHAHAHAVADDDPLQLRQRGSGGREIERDDVEHGAVERYDAQLAELQVHARAAPERELRTDARVLLDQYDDLARSACDVRAGQLQQQSLSVV